MDVFGNQFVNVVKGKAGLRSVLAAVAATLFLVAIGAQAVPPFGGTIFIDRDIVTGEDPSALLEITDAGRGRRTIYDRRVNDWISIDAFLFTASYYDGLSLEVQLNPEFGSLDAAAVEARKYAWLVGQLPQSLRVDIDALWINKGVELFGGGNRSILIHTGQSINYENDGIMEEALIHEAAHTSLDANHALSPAWTQAQADDGEFISTYALDFPEREDIAESFLPYLAIEHRALRISEALAATINHTIPNRIDYFRDQNLFLFPQGECELKHLSAAQLSALYAYIAFYGRPADAAGLAYWSSRLFAEDGSLSSIIDAFGNSSEYQRHFSGLSDAELIEKIYRQLYNRDPDPNGLSFYLNLLATGDSSLQVISLDILYGASGNDINVLDEKRKVAEDYLVNAVRRGRELGDSRLADLLAPVTDEISGEYACLGIARGYREFD